MTQICIQCTDLRVMTTFFMEIKKNVLLRRKHGQLQDKNVESTHCRTREDMLLFLDSVIPSLIDIISIEKCFKRVSYAVKRYDETKSNFLLPPEKLVIDIMHCLNRTVEKIVTMLLLHGVRKRGSTKRDVATFIKEVENVVNTQEFWEGHRNIERSKWEVPKPNPKSNEYFGVIKFSFKTAKQFFAMIEKLLPTCIPPNHDSRHMWDRSLATFKAIMTKLQQKQSFTDEEIDALQESIDLFGDDWVMLNGEEGVGNYLHYLLSGHVCFFLRKYRNLYHVCQQGWECFSWRMKAFYFRRTQRGGHGSGGSMLIPIYKCLSRRIAWAIKEIWQPLFEPDCAKQVTSMNSIYEDIATFIDHEDRVSIPEIKRKMNISEDDEITVNVEE